MNVQIKSQNQKGFTIIELVVVILLLGILAATALPRFMDVTDEAHAAVVDGVEGGLLTGAALFRAQWVATGQSTTELIADYGTGLLYANEDGYPIGTTAGIPRATTCVEIYNGLLQSGRPTAESITVANGADAQTTEEAVEGAAATTEIAAQLEEEAVQADSAVCRFYYLGQFREGTVASPVTVPYITFDFTTGEVGRGSLTLNLD